MALTPVEKQALVDRTMSWRAECTYQAKQYDRLTQEANFDAHRIEMAATYFLVAAGCVYFHVKEILMDKLTKTQADDFLSALRVADRDLQVIYDRRNWMNHGAIHNKSYELAKHHELFIQETLIDAPETKPSRYTMEWADPHKSLYKNMTDWHKKACDALDRLLDDDAILPPVCSATEDTPAN